MAEKLARAGLGRLEMAQGGVDARHQLGDAEWFGQEIISHQL